jgi:purine-binding chemotaxis protein CheW
MTQALTQLLAQKREISKTVVDVDEPSVTLVLVQIGQETFAFLGSMIREILANPKTYFIPGCPASLEGVMNLRGNIESVIRLDGLLQIAQMGADAQGGFVLLGETEQMRSGIRVEAVLDMIEVAESSLLTPPSHLPEPLARYVSRMLHYRQQPISVLDLSLLFDDYAQGLG